MSGLSQELVEGRVSFKKLGLYKPDQARRFGVKVDHPVFLSPQDSTEMRVQTYEVGKTLKSLPLNEEKTESITSGKGSGVAGVGFVSSRPNLRLWI